MSDVFKGMKELPEEFVQFLKDGDIRLDFEPARLILQGEHLSYLPENAPPLGNAPMRTAGTGVLRKNDLNRPVFLPGR